MRKKEPLENQSQTVTEKSPKAQSSSPEKRKRISDKEIISALLRSGGVVAGAARLLGCSRQTVSSRVNRSEKLRTAQGEAEDIITDMAIDKLVADISRGRPSAYTFWLKCKGKDRGFVERRETTGPAGMPLAPVVGPPPARDFAEWIAQNEQERELMAS